MKIVAAIMEGAMIQLATRFEVRRELMNESTVPIRTAAGTPRNRMARNMKVSPAVTLAQVLGIRIGCQLAMMAKQSSPRNSAHCIGVKDKQRYAAQVAAKLPANTIAYQ